MKKTIRFISPITLLLISCSLKAQNIFPSTGAAGIGTISPNSSSLLDITSTTKGVLFPRMTKAQRDAIASPTQGLIIYQTNNTPGLYYFDGGWSPVSPKNANRSLSNLTAPTAVNADLLPNSNNTRNIGSASLGWKNIYAAGGYYIGSSKVFDITGSGNTLLGVTDNSTNTGSYNTFAGTLAGHSNTTGSYNIANGAFALYLNTTGNYNTATGDDVLYSNIGGNYNTANGYGALDYNTSGDNNTAVGAASLNLNVTGSSNTATGTSALYANTGSYNTATGGSALSSNTTGNNNTAVGYDADVSSGNFSNSSAFGYVSYITASNQVRIGNGSVTSIGGYTNWTNVSDGRVKKNVNANVPGLAFINKLQPVTYNLNLDAADKILQHSLKEKDGKTIQPSQEEITARNEKEKVVYTGFIAQDVEKAAKSLHYDFSGVDAAKNDKDLYGLRYAEFVVPLVKAVQELSKANDDRDVKINDLQKQIDELKAMITSGGKSGQSAMSNELSVMSGGSSLWQNTPNPFNNTTTIRYTLPQKYSSAQIVIIDRNGKILKQLDLSDNGSGSLSVNASGLASGTYNYSLYIDGKMTGSKQMMLMK